MLQAIDNPFVIVVRQLPGSYVRLPSARVYSGGDLGWLQYRRANNNRLSEDEARFYASEILVGLQHMHSVGYMHRDVKPENVLLDRRAHKNCRLWIREGRR